MGFDFAAHAAEQRKLLDEFEDLYGRKDEALASECSVEFFKAVFAGDFEIAKRILGFDERREK